MRQIRNNLTTDVTRASLPAVFSSFQVLMAENGTFGFNLLGRLCSYNGMIMGITRGLEFSSNQSPT